MKNISIILGLTILFTACNLLENKEKKAIEICQRATDNAYLNALGLGINAIWLDYANMLAKNDPNKRFDWNARITNEMNVYIVSFVDQEGWGQRWEVDIVQNIVKYINANEYLCRKYGLSRFDKDPNFEIADIILDTLKIRNSKYDSDGSKEVVYILKACVINRTKKTLTKSEISGILKVIFKDKTVEGDKQWDTGFYSNASTSKPWNPDTKKDFYIETFGIKEIYLNYIPEYVFLEVNLKVEDPIGYTYNKNIAEYDLKDKWVKLKKVK